MCFRQGRILDLLETYFLSVNVSKCKPDVHWRVLLVKRRLLSWEMLKSSFNLVPTSRPKYIRGFLICT